jgi:hypothetical protein
MGNKFQKTMLIIILAVTMVYLMTGGVQFVVDPVGIVISIGLAIAIVYIAKTMKGGSRET